MAYYEISRTDLVGAHEVEAVIVRASGTRLALAQVTNAHADGEPLYGFLADGSNAHVRRLHDVKSDGPALILASYSA
jgi:hypothetical protein